MAVVAMRRWERGTRRGRRKRNKGERKRMVKMMTRIKTNAQMGGLNV